MVIALPAWVFYFLNINIFIFPGRPTTLAPKGSNREWFQVAPYNRENGFGIAKLWIIYEQNRLLAGQNSPLVDSAGLEPAVFSMPY